MSFKLYFLVFFIILFSGCLGPFKKQAIIQKKEDEQNTVMNKISSDWQKIVPLTSSKDQVISLIGYPNFIDNHKAGEDWHYNYKEDVGLGLISFPSSGHLTSQVQYIKRPGWEKIY